MLRSIAYVLISAAREANNLVGLISKTEASSTYFSLLRHSLHKLLTRIANSNGATFFPCGIPPRGEIVLEQDTLKGLIRGCLEIKYDMRRR